MTVSCVTICKASLHSLNSSLCKIVIPYLCWIYPVNIKHLFLPVIHSSFILTIERFYECVITTQAEIFWQTHTFSIRVCHTEVTSMKSEPDCTPAIQPISTLTTDNLIKKSQTVHSWWWKHLWHTWAAGSAPCAWSQTRQEATMFLSLLGCSPAVFTTLPCCSKLPLCADSANWNTSCTAQWAK